MDLLNDVLGLAGLALGCALWLKASRAIRAGGGAERWLDGALVLCWVGTVLFFLLAGLGVFRLWVAAGALIVTGALATAAAGGRRRAATSGVAKPLSKPQLSDPFLWAAFPLGLIALARLVKGMIAPPMAWDAMTTHLPKAAFWIQSASLALPDFPDAWTYYRWFPGGGEILFAWVMLPVRGDLLLGAFGFVVWAAIGIAGARLARVLGASSQNAWLASAAVAALPAALVFMTANYVENLVVVFVLLAIVHTITFLRSAAPESALLAAGASGLAIAVKTSSLVLVAPLVLALVVTAWRRRAGRRIGPSDRSSIGFGWLAAGAGALILPALGYLRTWLLTGSPFYPVRAPGLPLPHHQGLADLFSGRVFAPAALTEPGWEGFRRLFVSASSEEVHMNFGLGGALLAVAAVAGWALAVRRPGRRLELALCWAGAVLLMPLVLSPGNLALRTVWIGVLGRHLVPALAPVAVCAALVPGRFGRALLSASLVGSAVHYLPLGWSEAMTEPALHLAGAILILLLGLILLHKLGRGRLGPAARRGLAALAGIAFLAAWTSIRSDARHPIYRETAPALGAFDAHPIHPAFAMAASLWRLLDSPEEKRLAVTVGPDQVGHNQFFYPLLGSRLQNQLLHVPTSNDPEELVQDVRERYERARPEVWLANLEEASVDQVVGLWQPTAEREWLVEQPAWEVVALTDLGVPWLGRRRAP